MIIEHHLSLVFVSVLWIFIDEAPTQYGASFKTVPLPGLANPPATWFPPPLVAVVVETTTWWPPGTWVTPPTWLAWLEAMELRTSWLGRICATLLWEPWAAAIWEMTVPCAVFRPTQSRKSSPSVRRKSTFDKSVWHWIKILMIYYFTELHLYTISHLIVLWSITLKYFTTYISIMVWSFYVADIHKAFNDIKRHNSWIRAKEGIFLV